MSACVDCRRVMGSLRRGLCSACYWRHRTAGTLDRFPRKVRPSHDTFEDYLFLAAQGYTRRTAAERMGITKQALEKAIMRAARAA